MNDYSPVAQFVAIRDEVLVWKERSTEGSAKPWYTERFNRNYAGKAVGLETDGHGYLCFRIRGVRYSLHRTIWFLTYGELPKGETDHINGDRKDNCISNLRDVSPCENRANMAMRSDNRSGVVGVHWAKRQRRWTAAITRFGKTVRLGTFVKKSDAVAVRLAAQKALGFSERHGASK